MKDSTRYRLTKIKRAASRPRRTLPLLLKPEGRARLRYALRPPPHGEWNRGAAVQARSYRNYDDYLAHQRSKLSMLDLAAYDKEFRNSLAERLGREDFAAKSVLCLAARIGTEVKAFHDVGAFAVGIDLRPGPESTTVLHGDFHQLVFPEDSVDVVYSNSFDHALDLSRTLGEVRRVLAPDGLLLLDAQIGAHDIPFDDFAATSWSSIDDLVAVVASSGFHLADRHDLTFPWRGECLRFTLSDSSAG